MGPWKDMMDMGKGGDIGLAQETENETEISKKIKLLNHTDNTFFLGSGISRNLSLAPHKHRGTLPCTKAPAPPTIPDVKSESFWSPVGWTKWCSQCWGNFILVRKSQDWVWCTQENICTISLKSWLTLINFIIDHKVTRFSQGDWRSVFVLMLVRKGIFSDPLWSRIVKTFHGDLFKLWCANKKVKVKSPKRLLLRSPLSYHVFSFQDWVKRGHQTW